MKQTSMGTKVFSSKSVKPHVCTAVIMMVKSCSFEYKQVANISNDIKELASAAILKIPSLFRSLKCARITLHMNLFASFAVNNFLWLIWYYVIFDPNAISDSEDQVTIL